MGLFSLSKLFGMTIRESANDGSDFSNPDADYRVLFLGEDGVLHLRDSAGTVTTPGVSAGAVTSSGLTMATARLLGRTTASSGAVEEITVGSGLSLAAGSLTATGAAATAATVFMTADVTMTNANQYYDAASLGSLGAGDYLFSGTLAYAESSSGSYTTVRIWDGSAVYGEYQIRTENTVTASGSISPIKITLGGATTVKMSAACNAAGRLIKDVVGANGTADKATWISYLKIA